MSWPPNISKFNLNSTFFKTGGIEAESQSLSTSSTTTPPKTQPALLFHTTQRAKTNGVKDIDGVLSALGPAPEEKMAMTNPSNSVTNNNSTNAVSSTGGVTETGEVNEAQGKALLTEGTAKMEEAKAQGQDCSERTVQTSKGDGNCKDAAAGSSFSNSNG